MNRPLPQKQNLFLPSLGVSFAVHVLLLTGVFWSGEAPAVVVPQAPTSVEVFLIETPEPAKVNPEKDVPQKVLAVSRKAESEVRQVPEPRISEPKSEPREENKSVSTQVRSESMLKTAEVALKRGVLMTEASPDYLENPPPVYPRQARREGYEGTVLLEAAVTRMGTVSALKVFRSSGYSILDEAALTAVEKWEFKPARRGPVAFDSKVIVPIQFVLREE